jgi:asparagine synthetase B (glutamine-hydrolysing)
MSLWALLSGGLDSSLLHSDFEDKKYIHSIGLDANAPDVIAKAADFIGTEHHEVFLL